MINRILIRIKVVQMLYSYLLTRTEFKIQPEPDSTSRDKKYSYSLYTDLLLLILELSGYNVQGAEKKSPLHIVNSDNKLSSNKVAKSLSLENDIRQLISRGNNNISDFDEAVVNIYMSIIDSSVLQDYARKKNHELKDDVVFWQTVLNTIVYNNPLFIQALRKNPAFTNRGYELAVEMLNETLLSYADTRLSLENAKKDLVKSLDKAYELYHALLTLPIAITKMQSERLETAKQKYVPSYEDLNPNTRFIDNSFIRAIENNDALNSYLSSNPISWDEEYILVKKLLDCILASDIYANYMSLSQTTYEDDCDFWRNIFKKIILTSDDLAEALEAKSLYWNDDINIMGTFVLKSIKQIANNKDSQVALMPKFKDEEDKTFGPQLFLAAVSNREEYQEYIYKFINESQWDPERLAFMDLVIMILAISEIVAFPSIPLAVSLNEYIEIANYYSTPKSGQFINGILYSVINYLKKEGKLIKD